MEIQQEIQVRKLFIFDAAYSKSLVDIYLGTTSSADRSYQKLIIIIELARARDITPATLDTIMGQAVKAFENSRHATPEQVLEETLESLNILLPELAPANNQTWFDRLNLCIAISDRGQVHFAQLGEINVLHVHNNTVSTVSDEPTAVNPLKAFSHITSGLLDPGDAMIITTSSLTDYISDEKIQTLIQKLPPTLAIKKIESLIALVPAAISFASIFIKFTTELDELASRGFQTAATAGVITDLPRRQVLSDDSAIQQAHRRGHGSNRKRLSFGTLLHTSLKGLLNYFVILYRILRKTFQAFVTVTRALISATYRREQERLFIAFLDTRKSVIKMKLAALPRITKLSLFIMVLIVFILMHVLIIKSQKQQIKNIVYTYNETLASIAVLKQDVENAIIYKDERKTEALLITIDEALHGILPQNKEQEAQIAAYIDQNDRDLNKIRRINYIAQPFVHTDLTGLSDTVLSGFALDADGIPLVAGNQRLYRITGANPESIADAPVGTRSLLAGNKLLLVITEKGDVFRLSGKTMQPVDLDRPSEHHETSASVHYANNLYVLDASQGALFKYEGNGTTFKAGSLWVKNPDLLATANHFTIDGNVYAITKEATIIKMLRGQKQNFSYHELNPALSSETKIYTTAESNNLYILDKGNRRIVIMDKQGNIKDQFTSPSFENLTELAVNDAEDTIFVLNGKFIYAVAITK